MPDAGIINGGTTGGAIAVIVIAVKELGMKWLGRNRGWATKKELKEEIAAQVKDHEEKERFASLVLEERTKEINETLEKKVDNSELKVKIFEHQEKCIGMIRADMKEHQAQELSTLNQFQTQIMTLFNQFQENNRTSIARIHSRIDKIADKVGAGG